MHTAGERAERSSLPHVDGDASGLFQRHHGVHAAFAELRMTEHDFMWAERLRQIAQRRLADARAVDEDLGPRDGIDAQGARGKSTASATVWPAATRTVRVARISDAVRDQLESVFTDRQYDAVHVARPDQSPVLEDLHRRPARQSQSSQARRGLAAAEEQRRRRAGLDLHVRV